VDKKDSTAKKDYLAKKEKKEKRGKERKERKLILVFEKVIF